MSSSPTVTCLALETAVGPGSIAVIRHGSVVGESERGDARPSRAEHVLSVVSEVLSNAGIGLPDITVLAVSTGPGSYSGIRIGLSTALGLKNALEIDCRGVSILQAIATRGLTASQHELIAAVPVGKNDVAWQAFATADGIARELNKPMLGSLADLHDAASKADVIAPMGLLERMTDSDLGGSIAADEEHNLAVLVGMSALASPAADLTPIYLRSGTGF